MRDGSHLACCAVCVGQLEELPEAFAFAEQVPPPPPFLLRGAVGILARLRLVAVGAQRASEGASEGKTEKAVILMR